MSEKVLFLNGKKIILLGTAHISRSSIEQVKEKILAERPDFCAIELDEERLSTLKNSESWRNLDVIKVLKEGKGFFLLANIVLSGFQKRMGENVGVKPGDEMRAGIDCATELGIPAVMVDRPIKLTLGRAWRKNSLWGKCKLVASMLAAAFSDEKISDEEIEKLKSGNEMDSLMEELARDLPVVKNVLIDERDKFLACKIWETLEKSQKEDACLVAVLGAGHLPGVIRHLENLSQGTETSDVTEISSLPDPSFGSKLLGFAFPALLIGLIVAGFFGGGLQQSRDLALNWIFWNCSLAFLGTLLAGGHPLALLAAVVGAPIGTMSPVLGVGLFTGIAQAFAAKPRVSDLENLSNDAVSLKGFYKNRFLRVLLVFFLSSVGGAVGNFISVPTMITNLFG
ncbi:MAG: TraB/GumN family protein [Spirochaetaceae bacterium]|nr:TraB/GumN family protein [Spirochaetaceae bacterium]